MNIEQGVEMIDELEEKKDKGYEKLEQTVSQFKDQWGKISSKARQNAEATWANANELVQENPMASLGIALVVGAGLGALLTIWAKKD